MFGFLKKIGKGIGKGVVGTVKAIAVTALPAVISIVEPEALLSTAVAAVVKHTPIIPNKAIPALSAVANIGIRAAIGMDIADAVNDGLRAFTGGWAIHKTIKTPARVLVKNPYIAEKVGPGERFSL